MKVQLRYAAFAHSSIIMIDDQPLPIVSHLARFQGTPFENWCGWIVPAIAEEVNGKYALEYVGRPCEARILGQFARSDSNCTSFSAKNPVLPESAQVRLKKLSTLVQSGLDCPKINHTIYIYTDRYAHLVEELTIPKLSFCRIRVQVNPLVSIADHPADESAYVIVDDETIIGKLPVPISKMNRMLIEIIDPKPAPISVKDGTFIEHIPEGNASSLLDQYLELWAYADLLIKTLKKISIDEHHSMFLQVLALNKQEPVTQVRLPTSVEFGTSEPIKMRSIPSGTPSNDIAYRISDESVIKLEGNSLKAVGVGEVVVEAYRAGQNTKIASQKITCYRRNRVTSMTMSPAQKDIVVGQVFSVSYDYFPKEADDASQIKLSSSNGLVAVVESGLRVRGRSPGTCTIYAKSEQASANCTVNVYPKLEQLLLSIEKNVILVGESSKVKVERNPPAATLEKLKYSVSPSNVGRYEPGVSGFFAETPGNAELIVSTEDNKVVQKIPVTVKAPPNKVSWKAIIGVVIALIILYLLIKGV